MNISLQKGVVLRFTESHRSSSFTPSIPRAHVLVVHSPVLPCLPTFRGSDRPGAPSTLDRVMGPESPVNTGDLKFSIVKQVVNGGTLNRS